jgi:NAD(P) transhydrogenase
MQLDLLVIGSGPAGQRAAIQAAKLNRRVAIVERRDRIGGSSIHTGTIPSKALRAAVLEQRARGLPDAGDGGAGLLASLRERVHQVVAAESAVVREQLRRNAVALIAGSARFTGPQTVLVRDGDVERELSAARIVLAVGTVPGRPEGVEFDGRTVIDSDALGSLERIPRSLTVVGAGAIGVEYASIFGALGTRVTLVDRRARVLELLDEEIGETLQFHLRRGNVTHRMRESVAGVRHDDAGVVVALHSGKEIRSEQALLATGRQGATAGLGLQAAGLSADARGRVAVDRDFRTVVPPILADGDVAGPPGLAATAMEQGRIAALRALGEPAHHVPDLLPTGIYAIPEVAMVGRTEEQLTAELKPYVAGIARWSELARGLMSRDHDGMLKLLAAVPDGRLLGIHVLGTGATDLVHIGQAVMAAGGSVETLATTVFNYPTFAEAYKVAALDALNRLAAARARRRTAA